MKVFIIACFCFILIGCNNVSSEQKVNEISKEKGTTEQTAMQQPETHESEIESENRKKKKCDSRIVLETEENLDNISDDLIYLFLYTFDEECSNNAEFGEFSNEVLFQLIEKYPEKVAKNLTNEEINKEVILEELSSPINDIVDVKGLYKIVEEANIDDKLKSEILRSLKTAINKY